MIAARTFAGFSVGYLADRLARAIGWSPMAKLVAISDVEGPSARLFEGMTGTVRSVEGCAMTLEPASAVLPVWRKGSRLRLTPRHEGWTPFSLCLVPITVVVEAELPDGQPGPVAIASARVIRHRENVARD